ncbi:MAG: hypothetical protein ABSA68_18250 [Xanthobacteraceae bacterium]|jgi:hypothetical protein
MQFSIQQQIEEVEREIALREDVYQRKYIGRDKSRGEFHLARMRAVLKSLEWARDNREDVIAWIRAGKDGNKVIGSKTVFSATRNGPVTTTYFLGDDEFATARELIAAYEAQKSKAA